MREYNLLSLIGVLMVSTVGLTACGGGSSSEPTGVEQKSGRLMSATLIAEYSNNAISIPQIETKYPVKVYRVVYETKNTDGSFLDASGLLTIPQKPSSAKSPTLLYHHGTIYQNDLAPSNNALVDASSVLPGYLGFISVAPDYIGFGESSNQMHPYLNAEVTATTSIDLLRASQTFLRNNNILINDQLFLGGYSQGGSATLSTQRKIESDLSGEFIVTASSAGAGPYALSKELLDDSQENIDNFDTIMVTRPSNIGLIMKAMDSAYNLNIIDKIFQQPYASIIDSIYDGSHDSDFIDAQLTMQASQLFNKDFLQRAVDGNEPALSNAFKINDVFDWSPKAPTRLYHGRDDDWVAFSHAQTAFDTMLARGVSNIELVDCVVNAGEETNHANCFVPYLFSSYDFFLQFATDL